MPRIFISCDPADRPMADIVSQLVTKVLPDAAVHIGDHAVPDPTTLTSQLRESQAIVVLISPRWVTDPWLLFEAGVGLRQERTLLLLVGDMKQEQLPPPLRQLPAMWLTRKGLSRLLEQTARACNTTLPAKTGGVEEALYRLLALSPTPLRRRRRPSGAMPVSRVRERVEQMISRTHKALVRLIIAAMSPSSVLAEEDLDGMLLHQLRDIADYASVTYPTFLLYTLSSLQLSQVDGDEASWSLFNEEKQLNRLEQSLHQLEQAASETTEP